MIRLLLISLMFLPFSAMAGNIVYEKVDSVKIESLLSASMLLREGENRVLYFGDQFLGVPYVAHTLDRDTVERLVVNTRELDCTTFTETVVALALCSSRGERSFEDYCQQLRKIRYDGGECSYVKRNHYFTSWIENNERDGFVKKVESDKAPFTAIQHLNVNWMTQHYKSYAMLAANPEWLPEIKNTEEGLTGRSYRYIPKQSIVNSTLMRRTIHDGDIIVILTSKAGLDTSHIGIAVWKKDGMHLMNASQIHKKVVVEPMLMRTYMKKHPSQTGIRVCRVAQ